MKGILIWSISLLSVIELHRPGGEDNEVNKSQPSRASKVKSDFLIYINQKLHWYLFVLLHHVNVIGKDTDTIVLCVLQMNIKLSAFLSESRLHEFGKRDNKLL